MDAAHVLLVNPPYIRRHGGGVIPPIGLCYVAAALRAVGASVEILDLAGEFPDYGPADQANVEDRFAAALDDSPPLLVGFGPLVTASLRPVKGLSLALRTRRHAPALIVGGPLCAVPGADFLVYEFLRGDGYVAGDGERPVQEIYKAILEDRPCQAAGVGAPDRDPPQPYREGDLDSLPLPARDLLDTNHYAPSVRRDLGGARVTAAFLSRGCPYQCSFCAAPLSSGRKIRRFSPSRIERELEACARRGFDSIIFYDDCLFVKSRTLDDRILEFAQSVHNSGWRGTYQLELRCDAVVAMSADAVAALVSTGCSQVNMGIEKGHVAQLDQLRKRLTPEIAEAACSKLNDAGVRTVGTFIVGGPGETERDVEGTIEFACSLDLHFAHFNPLAIYPGTSLFTQEFGDRTGAEWLQLCLNEDLAPFGDILWRSEELSLQAILDYVGVAYSTFYSEKRLTALTAASARQEEPGLREAYDFLRSRRPESWNPSRAIAGDSGIGAAC